MLPSKSLPDKAMRQEVFGRRQRHPYEHQLLTTFMQNCICSGTKRFWSLDGIHSIFMVWAFFYIRKRIHQPLGYGPSTLFLCHSAHLRPDLIPSNLQNSLCLGQYSNLSSLSIRLLGLYCVSNNYQS